jgi:hypothetical protein
VALVDEDGRCLLTELWPRECACKWHRNIDAGGEVKFEEFEKITSWDAKFNGPCALNDEHRIHEGDVISYVREVGTLDLTDMRVACTNCTSQITNGGASK